MNSKDSQLTYFLVFGALLVVVPVSLALMFASSRMGPASIPIWFAVSGAGWLISKGPIGQAIAARIHGAPDQSELPEQVLAEIDQLRDRVAELEERQDFSERLLARKHEEALARPTRGHDEPE
ncbi:MAG TPA: hypothetical protein VFU45_07010 [Gemmatimonadales bacterium]|nr:hypothetical protein [Gemmatimonadales bacterium]